MSEKFTPGPWTVGRSTDCINQVEIEPAIGRAYGAGEEVRANARLIAAAPDLYQALVMVRDADNDCRKDGLNTIPDVPRAVIDAAIAKAEGQP